MVRCLFLDKDGENRIRGPILHQLLKNMGMEDNELSHIDVQSGCSLREFILFAASIKYQQGCEIDNSFREKFHFIDGDKDGYIGREDLLNFFCSLGVKDASTAADEIIFEFDFDGDGKLSLEEYKRSQEQVSSSHGNSRHCETAGYALSFRKHDKIESAH